MLFTLTQTAFAISASVSPGDDVSSVLSSLSAGDEIVFGGGTYELEGTLRIRHAAGIQADPVKLRAAEGAVPILKAISGATIFVVQDSSNVWIEGLTFEGNESWQAEGGSGVVIQNSTGVVFRDNTVQRVRGDLLRLSGDTVSLLIEDNLLKESSAGSALSVGCGDGSCWMRDSTIRHNQIHSVGTEENPRAGILLENGCQGNTVVDNTLYDISGLGLRVETTQLGASNIVEGNAVWDVGSTGIEVTGDAVVRNNVVFNTGAYGIRSYDASDDLVNVRITYNTVAFTEDDAVRLDNWGDKEGMVFSSNVLSNPTGRGFRYIGHAEGSSNRITANVVSGLVDGIDRSVQSDWIIDGAGSADFEDAAGGDFYPVPTSSLKGIGDSSGDAWVPEFDFNGTPRNGEAPTVGALQYNGPGNPGWVISRDFKGPPAERQSDDGGGCCRSDTSGGEAWLLLPLFGVFFRRRRAE